MPRYVFKDDHINYIVTIGSGILSILAILIIASNFSIGLFNNYYELTENEGIILILLLIIIIILNFVSMIYNLRNISKKI
ncbi:MAG: hypothetical protein ACFE95_17775 [Candidatus Hodarchaeota archaeon]